MVDNYMFFQIYIIQIVELEMVLVDHKNTLDNLLRKIALLQLNSSIQQQMEQQWLLTALINALVGLHLE